MNHMLKFDLGIYKSFTLPGNKRCNIVFIHHLNP